MFNNRLYRTADLNLSAYLKARYNLKIKELEPDPDNPDRAFFVFILNDDIDIEKVISDFFNENDLCSINAFMREISDLRSWLRNFKINK